jgi:hypothetical protein
MRDDPNDLGKAIRRLIQIQAMRRAADRVRGTLHTWADPSGDLSGPTIPPEKLQRGDWDRFIVPGPEGLH